ncbi:uncharacterized protein [Musca autumnalis]|uniref:uncharacterized protein n=1 Tax=Musca autumnalis TaxID=221902 RepID=UPI003CF00DF9
MGIMYKLMKHKSLNSDINIKSTTTTAKKKSDKCFLLTTTPTKETKMMNTGHISNCDVTQNDNDVVMSSGPPDVDYINPAMRKIELETEKRFTAEHILQLCKFLAEKSKRNKNLHKQQQSPKKLTKTHKQFQFQAMDDSNYDDDEDNDDDINASEGSQHSSEDMDEQCLDKQHHEDEFAKITCSRTNVFQNQPLPLLSHTRIIAEQLRQQQQQQVTIMNATNNILSTRLSSDINSMNISITAYQQLQQRGEEEQHGQQYQRLQYSAMDQQDEHSQQQQYQTQHMQQQQHHHHNGKRDILLKIRHQIFERKRLREKGYEPQSLNGSAAAQQVWRPW